MRRREFIAGLRSAAIWPLAARAQQGERARRIGVLMFGDENDPLAHLSLSLSAFTQALADLGWTDDRNVRMDVRWAGGDINLVRALARELIRLQPDIILTGVSHLGGAPACLARQAAHRRKRDRCLRHHRCRPGRARAADGYTITLGIWSTHIANAAIYTNGPSGEGAIY